MEGDPKVDELLRPVRAAIERHVKDRAAITDIYNRAYEVVMNSMDVKNGKTYCAYCGAEYPLDDNAATQVSEHIKTCKKHPMRAVEARAEAAEAQVAALQTALEEEGRRNAVFTACLHKAQNLYLEAHPDYPGWPDGAVNITWVLEAFDKERAEVKRLQTALAAANEDAARLAHSNTWVQVDDDGISAACIHCGKHAKYERDVIHRPDCPITLHRARVGGAA